MYNSLQSVSIKTIHHLYSDAITHKKPLVIVEGHDDPKKFREIFGRSVNLEPLIKPVELINIDKDQKYRSGYKGVLGAVKDLYEYPHHNKDELNKYVLGVIDKDSSNYSGRVGCDYPILFVLNNYSIESYFVSKNTVKFVFEYLINGESHNLTDSICESYYNEFKSFALDQLYYPSLEALKNSCISGYDCICGYSANPGHVQNMVNSGRYNEKINDLEAFSVQKNIEKKYEFLFDICKGKWLIARFVEFINLNSKNLKDLCSGSNKCIYCAESIPEKCVYKISFNPQDNVIEEYLYKDFPKQSVSTEFDDIVNRYDQMFYKEEVI